MIVKVDSIHIKEVIIVFILFNYLFI